MILSIRKGDLAEASADLLIVSRFQEEKDVSGATKHINDAVDGLLIKFADEDAFKGESGTSYLFRPTEGVAAKRVLIVGLGKKTELDAEVIRQASATAFQAAKKLKVKHVVSALYGTDEEVVTVREAARAMTEGVRLADYHFAKYRSEKEKKNMVSPETFEIVTDDGRVVRTAKNGMEDGEITAAGTVFARDLVNTPGLDMNPQTLVEAAEQIGKGKGTIRVRVYDRAQLKKMGAGGILGVAQGSEQPPYMVHMVYTPKKATKKKVCLVGKAVTFDSGGLSLKPAQYMESMKVDMAGSAAVLGAFSVIDALAPNVEVHGIFGAVENMPSGKALRPGDVLTAMNKKTIEVLNTDAEGRLTLADTLTYATRQEPDFIVDLATLTGACVVALGEEISAVMGNDEKVTEKVLEAAKTAGEKMWPMPLEKNYKKLIKSEIADVKNIGNRWGGSLTAGLFLQEFVGETPWVHIDIAGAAYAERPIDSYTGKGATGHGVRTLLELLRAL